MLFPVAFVPVSFLSAWHTLGSSWKKEPQLRTAAIRLGCGHVHRIFSWIMIDVGGPDHCSPGLYRKQTEQALWSKPVSHVPTASASVPAFRFLPCFEFLSWLPLVTVQCESRGQTILSSPTCFQFQCFIAAIETLPKALPQKFILSWKNGPAV